MKKRILFLAAVLLFAVLLFFWKEKFFSQKGEDPTATSTPAPEVPHVLKNAWILSSGEDRITFFFEGQEYTLMTKGKIQGALSDCVGDITVQEETIFSLVLKPDKVTAKVLRVDEESIELEGYGVLALAEDFKVYRLYDGVAEEPSGKLLVGSSENEFVLEDGKICASLLRHEPEFRTIRVLIGTEGYRGYYHSAVEVTADCGYTVTCGEKKERFKAGEICRFTSESFREAQGRRIITPEQPEGKITICNLKRAGGTPAYRGTLEVEARNDGLLVINEVTLEEYLYAVVPSEMPSTFHKEALKAQAICARSYAYTELLANRYAEYGAHVDDSIACQVYNNIGESEAAVLAVKDTYGQVLFHQGKVAQCYYFSTSSGYTTSVEDVWENAEELSYLSGKLHEIKEQGAGGGSQTQAEEPDDAAMARFLNGEVTTYDSESPWYRWQTFLPLETLDQTVETALKTHYATVPEQILTYDETSDTFCSKAIGEVGAIKSIRVEKRGTGGIVTELLVIGEKGVFLVKNEYNIRTVLAPMQELIYRKKGESVNGATLLPSAFIVLQKGIYREQTGYLITGGGYGHGVGMSQYGADAMARSGLSCEEIMEEYYPGTKIGFIYGSNS